MNVLKDVKRTLKNWWIFVALGILLIAASIMVFRTPVESYITLAWIFSILVLVNGFGSLFFCIKSWSLLEGRGWYLVGSIMEILIGIALITYPDLSVNMLPLFVGFWLLFRASFIVSAAFELKGYGYPDWGWILAFGILAGVFSFMVLIHPVFGAGVVVYFTAIAILLMGLAYISLGMQLKKIKASTIDKIHEFKKDLKKSFDEAINLGAAAVAEAAQQVKREAEQGAEDFAATNQDKSTETDESKE